MTEILPLQKSGEFVFEVLPVLQPAPPNDADGGRGLVTGRSVPLLVVESYLLLIPVGGFVRPSLNHGKPINESAFFGTSERACWNRLSNETNSVRREFVAVTRSSAGNTAAIIVFGSKRQLRQSMIVVIPNVHVFAALTSSSVEVS